MTFGERLKSARNSKGFTQQELADKLNVPRPTIAGYETKGYEPSFDTLNKISDILNVSTDYLLGRVDDPDIIKVSGNKLPKELRDVGVKYIEMAKSMEDKDMSIEDIEQIIKMLEIQKILEEEENKKE